jgi:hypothetical protein
VTAVVVTELAKRDALKEVRALSTSDEFVRTPGCHVTAVITHVMQAIDPEYPGSDLPEESLNNMMAAGFVWEELLTKLFARRINHVGVAYQYLCRPGEVEKDGIIGSPDGVGVDEDGPCLVESKLTWKSRRGFDLDAFKFLAWKYQVLAYGYLMDLSRCYMPIFFVNDQYDKYVPSFPEYRIDMTVREQRENWTMLKNMARHKGLVAA